MPSHWEPEPWWLGRDELDAEVWRMRKTDPAFDAACRAREARTWRAVLRRWWAQGWWYDGPGWPVFLAVLVVTVGAGTFGVLVLLDVRL